MCNAFCNRDKDGGREKVVLFVVLQTLERKGMFICENIKLLSNIILASIQILYCVFGGFIRCFFFSLSLSLKVHFMLHNAN